MRRLINKLDKQILIISIVLIIFGSLMILSASSIRSFMEYGIYYKYFMKQLVIISVGLIASYLIIKIPLKTYKYYIYFILIALITTLVILLISGTLTNNVRGWFYLFGFGIQPSEFAKLILIIFMSIYFERIIKTTGSKTELTKLIFFPFGIAAIIVGLIFAQPDYGTALIIMAILGLIFFIIPLEKKIKISSLLLILGIIVVAVIILLLSGKSLLRDYQKSRLIDFRSPCQYYREAKGYQVCNGFIAINTGGLTGVGIGNSKQKYLYLPEAHTDFIFPIIVEETGLIVGGLVLLSYFLLLARIIIVGRRSHTLQGYIIAYGIAFYIFIHIVVNLGGVLGIIPLTGVPLPFLSYGGSYMLTLMMALAFVQRVEIENKIFFEKNYLK